MGEARRRGTKEQRIAQAVEREKAAQVARTAARRAAEVAESERIRKLPPEIRKEVLLRRSSPKHRALMLAAAMALAIPPVRK